MNPRITVRRATNLGQGLRLLALGLLTAIVTGTAHAADLRSTYTWKPVKIGGGGYVTGMVVHPSVPNVVYCRTDVGGAYRWNPSTSSWTQLITDERMPSALMNAAGGNPGVRRKQAYAVESIAIDPSDANVLYLAAGRGDGGFLLKSTDGGTSFSLLPLSVHMGADTDYRWCGERLEVKPGDSNVVLFGSRKDGLWRSTNGGASWAKVPALPAGSAVDGKFPGICVVLFDPATPSRVYASVGGSGIYRSDDSGLTWTSIAGAALWAEEMEISQGVLYVCGAKNSLGVRKYTPASGWTTVSPSGQTKIEEIAVDPNNANRIFATTNGFTKLWRSTNGGATWQELGTNSAAGRANFRSPGIPWVQTSTVREWLTVGELMIDPHNSSRIWFSEGMGMWRCQDATDTNATPRFDNISHGIEEMVATDIVALPGGRTVKTTWDRVGFVHTNPDAYPGNQLGLSTAFSSGWSLATSPANPNFVAALVTDHRAGFIADFSGISTNGGDTWTRFPSNSGGVASPTNLRFGELAVSASNPSHMVWYPRRNGTDMYYTTNGGSSWNLSSITLTDWNSHYFGSRRRLASDGATGGKFYYYRWTDGAVLASTNSGASFQDAGGRLPTTTYWSQLKSAPGRSNHLWFVTGWDHWNTADAGVYRSTNGGASFQPISAVEVAWAIGFGKAAPGATYPCVYIFGRIAGNWGVYRSPDEGATWDRCSGFPLGIFDQVSVVTGDPDVFGKVYVGWAGNSFAYGVAAGTPPPPPPPPPPGASIRIQAEDRDNTTNFAPFTVAQSSAAADGEYIVVPEGTGSVTSFPTNGQAKYGFDLPTATSVGIWARVRTPNSSSDSFYMDVTGDTSSPSNWGTGVYSAWTWRKWKQVSLPAGEHTLTVAYREDGAELDELYISVDGSTPQ